MTTLRLFFFFSLLLTGFFAGIGFVNAVGIIPAMEVTPVEHWAPYWQALDQYMRVRMPVLGIPMLLSLIVTIVLLARQKPVNRGTLLLAIASLVMVLADLYTAFSMNLPINEMLQALDPDHVPASFETQKQQAAKAFYLRSVTMILSLVFMLLSYFRFEASKTRA
jgi:uncharacterized membrane protein